MYTQAQPFQVLHLEPGCSPWAPCQPEVHEEDKSWSGAKFRILKKTNLSLPQSDLPMANPLQLSTNISYRACQALLDLA